MPQLNPHPWFMVLVSSWLLLLLVLTPKVLRHSSPNEANLGTKSTQSELTWIWPWY
uniref:ATP synthase complex subunit 8 n=1 Tax=Ceratias uranoscopus TaxID=412660 RepID=D3KS41_CETUR|nr:ATP synthase F0 subunit 8 [Ceratias uranoscopus]BAI77278.1 ATPase subunit 8 [Ceratias uranoscopus]